MGCGGGSVERHGAGAKSVPCQAQTVTHVVKPTGLAAFRGRGSFQHLRGRMFCGALAKCDLAPFGCDSFHQLPAHSLTYERSKLPSSPQNHSSFSNATFSSRVLSPVTVAIRANSVFHDSGGADSRGGTTCLALRRKVSTIAP